MRYLKRWLETYTGAESIDICRDLASYHARRGGRVGAKILLHIARDELRELCLFEVDYNPRTYLSPDSWRAAAAEAYRLGINPEDFVRSTPELAAEYIGYVRECRQALAYFQKLSFAEIGIDKAKAALDKFLEAEAKCKETNHLFSLEQQGKFQFIPYGVSGILHAATQRIARVLGRCPSISEIRPRFGPGATVVTPKKRASLRRKVSEALTCSRELSSLVPYLLEEVPAWLTAHSILTRIDEEGEEWETVVVRIEAARLAFVLKNAKTFRTVVIGPGLNTFWELGYGACMETRLAAFGIDIRDQSVNQERARIGSLTGALATLDLVSASDMNALGAVRSLLPLDWVTALSRLRTRSIKLPSGAIVEQEKFSAMGNGYTFPLQTLIFWAIAASCCEKESDVTVYGDDIVVPTQHATTVVDVLHAIGFKVNTQKSYWSGPFRESCGKDYVWGVDVRPLYLKDKISVADLFVLHNGYVRNGDAFMASKVEAYIHPRLRLYGPDGYGDGHLIKEDGLYTLSEHHRDAGYRGYFFSTFQAVSSVDKTELKGEVEYAAALYRASQKSSGEAFWPACSQVCNLEAPVGRTHDKFCFAAKYAKRAVGPRTYANEPLKGDAVKHYDLPEVVGWKKVSVYVLG